MLIKDNGGFIIDPQDSNIFRISSQVTRHPPIEPVNLCGFDRARVTMVGFIRGPCGRDTAAQPVDEDYVVFRWVWSSIRRMDEEHAVVVFDRIWVIPVQVG